MRTHDPIDLLQRINYDESADWDGYFVQLVQIAYEFLIQEEARHFFIFVYTDRYFYQLLWISLKKKDGKSEKISEKHEV